MTLLDNIKNIPAELVSAIKRVSETGAAEVIVEKTFTSGAMITIKVAPSSEGLDLNGMTREELNSQLADLEQKLGILQADEPEFEGTGEYAEWEDTVNEIQDQIEAVHAAINDLEE